MHGSVSFFELGVADAGKGRAFYEALFGWEFQTGPSGNGWVISTPEQREVRGAAAPLRGSGGMHPGDAGAVPYLFFEVDDMDAALERVQAMGGEIVDFDSGGDESSEERFGRFKFCKDDQGSSFGLHQPPAR